MNFFERFFNFDNIGKKIKNLVKCSCWITIMLIWIAAPITFIALVADEWTAYLCWIPLVSAIFGPIFIWISCWGLYAFGELVDKVSSGTHNANGEETKEETQDNLIVGETKKKDSTKPTKFACPKCGNHVTYGDPSCICGQTFDWSQL